jgi:hypothetical protein
MVAKHFIFILPLFLVTATYGQVKTSSLGIRIGYNKNSYYDESINYKIYNGYVINPYQLRFIRNTDKNTYIANLFYISNTLNPVNRDKYIINDNINFHSVTLDFTYLRQFITVTDKLNFRIGLKLNANAYLSDRIYQKTFGTIPAGDKSYEVTFFSLAACGQIKYIVSQNSWFNLNFDFPFLALNLKNYNSRAALFETDLCLVSMDKYSGFTSDLAFVKKFNRFSLEIFQTIYFIKYKEPYSKRVLTNKIGIGLYYEF